VLLFSCYFSFAQGNKKEFQFKKGEVLDVVVLSATKTNYKELFDKYKKTAFPVAFKHSYQPQPGFRINKLTLGNHLSSSFIIGKWGSVKKREDFLLNVEKEVPDFHEQRRALFTNFELTYYEINKDLKFSINKEKYNVVTSFWVKKKNDKTFYKHWKKRIEDNGGKIILKLTGGKSPTGYYYNPEVLSIVEWDNEEQFIQFSKKYPISSYNRLKDVHQFVIG